MMIISFSFSLEYNRDFDHAKSVRMRQCLEEIINNNTDLLCVFFFLPIIVLIQLMKKIIRKKGGELLRISIWNIKKIIDDRNHLGKRCLLISLLAWH